MGRVLAVVLVVVGCSVERTTDTALDGAAPTDGPSSDGSSDGFVPGDGFAIDAPIFDVPEGGLAKECRIATLGNKGDAGVSDLFAKWLDKSGGKASAALADAVLTAVLLAPYRVIVVQNVSGNHTYDATEIKVLSDWVKAGGGLMTLTGFAGPTEVVNVNGLLSAYDVGYDNKGILFGGGTTVAVDTWTPHAVTKGVTRIGIDNGYAVIGSGTKLAKGGGHDVLEVRDVGSGHVLVWGDEWITFNSEWASHPDYQVQTFWQNIVDWFAPGAGCKVPDPPK